MQATVCQCCGLSMSVCSARSANMCADCESLAFDDSPVELARTCAPQPAGHSSTTSLPKAVEFTCEIVFNDGVQALPS